jgi:Serine carboxypeptidase
MCTTISPRRATGCVLLVPISRMLSTKVCAPSSTTVMQISSSTSMVLRPWCVQPPSPQPVFYPLALTMSLYAQVASLNTKFSSSFNTQKFANFTVNGVPAGLFKNAGTFSYLRVFGAGHEVPAYQWQGVPRGAAALQMFTQIMSGHPLSGT